MRNAREALKQATDLARRNSDFTAISQLVQNWVRIDRSGAPGALEDLCEWQSTAARDAANTATYQRCMSSAQTILRSLSTLDAELAVALWRRWPDPPTLLGEEFRSARPQADAVFLKQLSGEMSGFRGPGADLTSLKQSAAKGNYSAAAQVASQLIQTDQKGEALQIVDQAIADFRQRELDPRTVSTYFSFVRQLPGVDPERYLRALNSLLPALAKQASPNAGGTVKVGDQSVQVTARVL